jgi:benzylsuccinate CoA-transferase BbsF subunit
VTYLSLDGIRVLDFTWAGAGPFVSSQLALMGAQIVKVEHPSRPDLMRIAARSYGWAEDLGLDSSAAFNELAAGKRSIVVDLKSTEGRDLSLALAAKADVICENMRPGKMESLGLGYDSVRNVNPAVVYCSVSGTGRFEGLDDAAGSPGYAPIFWAEGGAAWLTGWPEGAPVYTRAPADMCAGAWACLGVLASLHERSFSGRGTYVDLSATEAIASCLGDALLAAAVGVEVPGREGNDRAGFAPNDTYPSQVTGLWVAISVESDEQWRGLCNALELSDLASDVGLQTSQGRWSRREELYEPIASRTRKLDAVQLEGRLHAAGVPCSRVASLNDLFEDEGLRQRGFWQEVVHPKMGTQRIAGLAWLSDPPFARSERSGPLMGEATDEILASWLGLGEGERDRLRGIGAIQ